MSNESKATFVDGLFIGVFVMIFAALIILGVTGVHMAGTNGYCAALNGESITYNVCNVNGKVVDVP